MTIKSIGVSLTVQIPNLLSLHYCKDANVLLCGTSALFPKRGAVKVQKGYSVDSRQFWSSV